MIDKKLRAIVWRCILMGCVAFWIGLAYIVGVAVMKR
nr:MAG TPA: hypothetical protein [Caudoviricetes sp.]